MAYLLIGDIAPWQDDVRRGDTWSWRSGCWLGAAVAAAAAGVGGPGSRAIASRHCNNTVFIFRRL